MDPSHRQPTERSFGLPRTRGERAGRIVEELRRVGVRNPVFVLDEVDRLDEAGGAAAALLEAVVPPPGAAFRDRYLDLPFDLSEALFVATATSLGSAPTMLRERTQVIELPGYAETEKREIATRYLLPGLLRLHGLTADQVEFTEEAVGAIIGGYMREAGVWRLAAVLGEVCAKVVRRRSEGDTATVVVTPAKLAGMLGAPRHRAADVAGRTGRPGVAVGLCCTASGAGAASVIEASRMAGSGALTLTGGLGGGHAGVGAGRAVVAAGQRRALRHRPGLPSGHGHPHLHVDGGPGEGTSGGVTMAAALTMVETQLAADASVRRPPSPRGQRAVGPQASEGITRIGEGTVIEGEVTGGEDLVIKGTVDGTIELPNHVLTVGPSGSNDAARTCCRSSTSTSFSPCPRRSPRSPRRTRPSSTGCSSGPSPTRSGRSLPTRATSAPSSASSRSSIPGARRSCIIPICTASFRVGGSPTTGAPGLPAAPGFFLPVRVLSRYFRRVLLAALQDAFEAGQLHFAGRLQPLSDPPRFAEHLRPARQTEWVVYAKRPFAGPEQVLDLAAQDHLLREPHSPSGRSGAAPTGARRSWNGRSRRIWRSATSSPRRSSGPRRPNQILASLKHY